jgi:hypothetical protein
LIKLMMKCKEVKGVKKMKCLKMFDKNWKEFG